MRRRRTDDHEPEPASPNRVSLPHTHRALELRPPERDGRRERSPVGEIRRRDRLGGLIHEYYRAAALRCDTNNGALQAVLGALNSRR